MLSGPRRASNLEQSAATPRYSRKAKSQNSTRIVQPIVRRVQRSLLAQSHWIRMLSRDVDEVQNTLTIVVRLFFTNRLVAEMSQCALEAAQAENIGRIPKSLPILLLSGTQDAWVEMRYVRKLAPCIATQAYRMCSSSCTRRRATRC